MEPSEKDNTNDKELNTTVRDLPVENALRIERLDERDRAILDMVKRTNEKIDEQAIAERKEHDKLEAKIDSRFDKLENMFNIFIASKIKTVQRPQLPTQKWLWVLVLVGVVALSSLGLIAIGRIDSFQMKTGDTEFRLGQKYYFHRFLVNKEYWDI